MTSGFLNWTPIKQQFFLFFLTDLNTSRVYSAFSVKSHWMTFIGLQFHSEKPRKYFTKIWLIAHINQVFPLHYFHHKHLVSERQTYQFWTILFLLPVGKENSVPNLTNLRSCFHFFPSTGLSMKGIFTYNIGKIIYAQKCTKDIK